MAGHVAFSVTEKWEGDRVTRAVGAAAARGVNRAAAELKALSVPLAPIRDGILRGSAAIREANDAHAEAMLVFDTPYAAKQHEETEYNHPQGGQAKYVEEPLAENAGRLQGIIAKEIRHAITQA